MMLIVIRPRFIGTPNNLPCFCGGDPSAIVMHRTLFFASWKAGLDVADTRLSRGIVSQ